MKKEKTTLICYSVFQYLLYFLLRIELSQANSANVQPPQQYSHRNYKGINSSLSVESLALDPGKAFQVNSILEDARKTKKKQNDFCDPSKAVTSVDNPSLSSSRTKTTRATGLLDVQMPRLQNHIPMLQSQWQHPLRIHTLDVDDRLVSDDSMGMLNCHWVEGADLFRLQIDPGSLWRLCTVGGSLLNTWALVFLGTIRLLAPLIVARRILNVVGDLIMDWYRGYYIRTTYETMHLHFHKYYQGPAILRSFGRLLSQMMLLFGLGRLMEWMVGLSHAPCVMITTTGVRNAGGCHWWCVVLWLIAVVGSGHAGAAAIAVWGGPLRIQTTQSKTTGLNNKNFLNGFDSSKINGPQRPSARSIFTRPWRLLNWMRDPDQWIREIANNSVRRRRLLYNSYLSPEPLRPFHPDPLLFPATWEPLKLLLLMGLVREMTFSRGRMHIIMRQILIQQSFADEWYRVLLCEKRVGIGILVMLGFLMSSLNLLWTLLSTVTTSTNQNDAGLSILLVLPYSFAVIVSAYMNIYFYNDIRIIKKQVESTMIQPNNFWLQYKFLLASMQE